MYLHNFTEILSDSISVHSSGKLNYSIRNQPETTHSLLLKKSNNKFEIVIWSEKVSGSDDIVVNLDSAYRNIYIYDPTIGIDPVQTLEDKSSAGLKMTDHPIIIEIAK